MKKFSEKHIVALWIAFGMLAAALLTFFPDDTFITMRYARNLAEGFGPVWNPGGEPVEGYTNFLWMLVAAFCHLFLENPVPLLTYVGILLWATGMWLSWTIAKEMTRGTLTRICWLVAASTHYSLLVFSGSGMETGLHFFLLTAAVYLVLVRQSKGFRPILLGFVLAGLLMTRPDTALFVGILLVWHWSTARKERVSLKTVLLTLGAIALPIIVWLGWKFTYYGQLLPNTFYAKTGGGSLYKGLLYLFVWMLEYGFLFLPILLGIVGYLLPKIPDRRKLSRSLSGLGLALFMVYFGYMVLVGGDFMEFRMFAPMVPLLLLCLFQWLEKWVSLDKPGYLLPLTAVLLFGFNVGHALTFGKLYYTGFIISAERLEHEVAEPIYGLSALGEQLQEEIGGVTSLKIAVSQAGALPYQMPQTTFLDVLGLNDQWVARQGKFSSDTPGHLRIAPFSYLLRENVHLIVGRWTVRNDAFSPFQSSAYPDKLVSLALNPEREELPPNTRIVLLPISKDNFLVTIYLREHPAIEKGISAERFPSFDFDYP